MPQAWLIGPFVIKLDLLFMIISFLLGVIFLYVLSPYSKENTKKAIDSTTNLLFTLVVAIWIGKILLNIQGFIADPIAILAYPSNTNALYIGIVLTLLFSRWKWVKTSTQYFDSLFSWNLVFITAQFSYTFLQHIFYSSQWLNVIGLLVLVMYIVYVSNKKSVMFIGTTTLIGWSLIQIILNPLTYTAVFQFSPHFTFYVFLILVGFLQWYFLKSKKLNGGGQL